MKGRSWWRCRERCNGCGTGQLFEGCTWISEMSMISSAFQYVQADNKRGGALLVVAVGVVTQTICGGTYGLLRGSEEDRTVSNCRDSMDKRF